MGRKRDESQVKALFQASLHFYHKTIESHNTLHSGRGTNCELCDPFLT